MKVHVICQGLFGVVIPEAKDFVEAVFLDAAGWKDPGNTDHHGTQPSLHIPQHELFIRFTASNGKIATRVLKDPRPLEIKGMPAVAPNISSQPVTMNQVLGDENAAVKFSQGCAPAQPVGSCLLNQKPLVMARLRLSGGELRNCEFDLANGIDFSDLPNGWGHQELKYEWALSTGSLVRTTFNAVCFTFETSSASLLVDTTEFELAPAGDEIQRRLRRLGTDFALILLNNTVSKQSLGNDFHIEPDRDTHSLLFHDLLDNPLPIKKRPIPQLVFPTESRREAPPLNRCIPYSYNS